MRGAMILMLLLLYPVLVTARVSTRTTNRRPSRDRHERLKVTVTTSTEEDADTDDDVYLQLFGSKRNSNSPYMELDTEANDFELGAVDVFTLISPYIADIAYIKLKTGDDDGWLVKEVTLEWVSVDQGPIVFNFSSWIDDGGFLFAYTPLLNPARYRVTVETGHQWFAGTDATVTITLSNGTHQTYPYILDKDDYDDLEIRSVDVFDLTTEDIGRIRAISVDASSGDIWYLVWVSVVYVKTGHEYKRTMDKWYT